MPAKYIIKNNRKSYRLQDWDYTKSAAYFITICSKDKEHYFGYIKNNTMLLSNVGVIANIMWYEIKNHAKNVQLDAFVVMPNHIHGIIILNDDVGNGCCVGNKDNACIVPTDLRSYSTRYQNMGSNSLSSIIGSYKSAVTKHANRLELTLYWQPRFYDHIIRDDASFERIQNYINNNPKNWNDDKLFEKKD